MSIAEKLTPVAENMPKIYEKGKTDFGYKKRVSGDPIHINDININEKTLNALLTSDSLTDFSKNKIRVCGKNILRLPAFNSSFTHPWNSATNINITVKNGVFTARGFLGKVDQSSVVFNPYIWGMIANYAGYITMDSLDEATAIKLPKGTYTFFENKSPDSVASGSLAVYTGATYATVYNNGSTFTITKDGCYGAFIMHKMFTVDIPDFYYSARPMLVCGEELPEMYEAYVGKDYTADADGTINNITPYYPITNMFVQGSSDAVINTNYYVDGEKVVQNLTDTIISLGGTV